MGSGKHFHMRRYVSIRRINIHYRAGVSLCMEMEKLLECLVLSITCYFLFVVCLSTCHEFESVYLLERPTTVTDHNDSKFPYNMNCNTLLYA